MPGAVGIFADALFGDGTAGSGDTAKLFKEMEAGRIRLDEIRKVIHHMGTLTREDLIARMLETPEKKLNLLRNEWHRFVMQLNDAGLLDAMVAALKMLTEGIKILRTTFKPVQVFFRNLWGHIKDVFNLLKAFASFLVDVFFADVTKTGLTLLALSLYIKHVGLSALFASKFFVLLWKRMLVPAAITSAYLLLEDLLFALQGKGSVLSDMAKDGEGFAKFLSQTLISLGAIVQLVMGMGLSIYDRLVGTGDWGYFFEVWDNFKNQMKDIWPIDQWEKNILSFINKMEVELTELGKVIWAVGKFAGNPLNPFNAADAYSAINDYGSFRDKVSMFDANKAAMAPNLLARQNPYTSSGMNQTNYFTINDVSDPQAVADAVTQKLNQKLTLARSNYVMVK